MAKFSDDDRRLLEQYVTSTEADVFAIKNLSGIVGAVFARYSRAKTGFRETLLDEFVKEGQLDPKHANDLIERVLIAYGDDSVGELEGAHLALENISTLATKEVEDRRIGGSPIEKSTRYVFFDQKDEQGQYKYVRPSDIMDTPLAAGYVQTMDFVFDTYSSLIEPLQEYYAKKFPVDEVSYDILGAGDKQKLSDLTTEKDVKAFQMTHKIDQKTKACDTLRCLLPLATKTNVGLFANGRFFQHLISHLMTSSLAEVRTIGDQAMTALSQTIPQYVRRAKLYTYRREVDEAMGLAQELLGLIPVEPAPAVTLAPTSILHHDDFLVAQMLYGYSHHPLMQLYRLAQKMPPRLKQRIKQTYVGNRGTRRDRPGRAFEGGYTNTFDLMADFGTYKDLMRHRMTTQIRQPFSPVHGFIVPDDLADAGFSAQAMHCHDRVATLYNRLHEAVGDAASYVTLHGHRVRWILGFNDREAMHLLELRTQKQGHPQYRKLCQQMHQEIAKVDPWRASIMTFVDHNDYNSARGDSEAKQRVKERQLEEKEG